MLSVKHLIDANDLTREDIEIVLATASSFAKVTDRPIKKLPTLRGRTIINLFLEPSTRTRTSFEVAAKRLSADTFNIAGSSSAVAKGESLRDTVETLNSMDADMIVVRSRFAGSPQVIADCTDARVINGGDGKHQHPTQALLDLYTMRKHFDRIDGLHVAIVGDILHSRVSGSLIPALLTMGARVTLVGPPTYMPIAPEVWGVEVVKSIDEIIDVVDVVYLLRIQLERAEGASIPSLREYARFYGMNAERMKLMKPEAMIMHPGPMNRGVEITSEPADSPRSLILDQVNSGVAVRMAALYLLLGGTDNDNQ